MADLELASTDEVTHLYKLYSGKGWAKEEPFDKQWRLQEPRVLSDALSLIVSSGRRFS